MTRIVATITPGSAVSPTAPTYDGPSARVTHEGRPVTIHGSLAPALPVEPRPNRRARRGAASRFGKTGARG
jgi:hypothetical protein